MKNEEIDEAIEAVIRSIESDSRHAPVLREEYNKRFGAMARGLVSRAHEEAAQILKDMRNGELNGRPYSLRRLVEEGLEDAETAIRALKDSLAQEVVPT